MQEQISSSSISHTWKIYSTSESLCESQIKLLRGQASSNICLSTMPKYIIAWVLGKTAVKHMTKILIATVGCKFKFFSVENEAVLKYQCSPARLLLMSCMSYFVHVWHEVGKRITRERNKESTWSTCCALLSELASLLQLVKPPLIYVLRGLSGHLGRDPKCPARGQTCRKCKGKCKGKDHFASVCKTKPKKRGIYQVQADLEHNAEQVDYAYRVT